MMPDSFQRIELGRVFGQVEDLDESTVFGKPHPHVAVFVVRCVVLNQEYFPGIVASQDLLQIPDVCHSTENCLKVIKESRTIQLDGTKNLQRVSLPRRGDFWLRTTARPSAVEGGILPEARFVLVEECSPFALGFFLIFGYLYRAQRSCAPLSACARVFLGRWTENPS